MKTHSEHSVLLVSAREAAHRLGISPRLLWTLTNMGKISCVRCGRAVREAVENLLDSILSDDHYSLGILGPILAALRGAEREMENI